MEVSELKKMTKDDVLNFIREKGVVGLAVGFLMGGAISKVVTALVNDIINPLLSLVLGRVGGLKEASLSLGSAEIMWGDMLAVLIDFIVIAFVVYIGVKNQSEGGDEGWCQPGNMVIFSYGRENDERALYGTDAVSVFGFLDKDMGHNAISEFVRARLDNPLVPAN